MDIFTMINTTKNVICMGLTVDREFPDIEMGGHPLLKGKYTGHEITYLGDHNISPRLAETKRNQKKLGKSDLPIFLGGSRFPSG